MNKKRIREWKIGAIVLFSQFMIGINLMPTVYAGGLNSNEAAVLSYLSGTFEYQGSKYRVSSEKIAQLRGYLCKDGVDMTAAQKEKCISNFCSNMGAGVKNGWAVRIEDPSKKKPESDSTASEEKTTENSANLSTDKKDSMIQALLQAPDNSNTSNFDSGEIAKKVPEQSKPEKSQTVPNKQNASAKNTGIIKNTGMGSKDIIYVLEGIVLLFIVTFILSIICIKGSNNNRRVSNGSWIRNIFPIIYIMVSLFLLYLCKGSIKQITNEFSTGIWKGQPKAQAEDYNIAWISDTTEEREKLVCGQRYGTIYCDRVGLKAPLYYGDDDKTLELGAGQYPSGSLLGEESTVLIGGHDNTYFKELEEIETGDVIEFKEDGQIKKYRVDDLRICSQYDESAYDLKAKKDQVILYTCYPFGDSSKTRDERYFVYCTRTTEDN